MLGWASLNLDIRSSERKARVLQKISLNTMHLQRKNVLHIHRTISHSHCKGFRKSSFHHLFYNRCYPKISLLLGSKVIKNQGGCKLTNIMPMSIDVDPIIKALSLHFIHAQTPEQVPVISPPKMVPINSTAPEQSYATSASTPVD